MKTLYFGGTVYLGAGEFARGFALEDGRFTQIFRQEPDPAGFDRTVDLGGTFVCPGFHDSHMHLLSYGHALTMAPLAEHTHSLEDMLRCLGNTGPAPCGWILGRGWNQDYFAEGSRMPTRRDLDRVSAEYPVCATRACGHALAVNSRALELLGITGDTPQIPGGEIVMEEGQPNGIFLDNAMELVTGRIPLPDKDQVKQMLRAAAAELNRRGITSCQSDDYCVFQNLPWAVVNQAFRELEEEGLLTLRVTEQANLTTVAALEDFIRKGNNTGTGTDRFRIGPLKLLGDGALGARTAFLSRPYADEPGTRGLSVFTGAEFDALIGCAHRHGMQVAVHCIGDACLDLVLSSIGKALAEYPREDHRHGIVHCQITRPDQLERIAALKLQVYAQSIFLDYDIHMVRQRVGEELARSSYSWKTLMEKGVCVSNGSDCPVEAPDVLAGIQCAVTRCDLRGRGPYLPGEAFSVQEALDSFTVSGARSCFEEGRKGRIAPGLLADFTVLGANPFTTDPSALKDIPVLGTCLGGEWVFRA